MCWDDLLFFDGVLGCLFLSLLWQRALSNRRAVSDFKRTTVRQLSCAIFLIGQLLM
jgi:hypothetical protein